MAGRDAKQSGRLDALLAHAREPALLLTPDRRIAAANRAWLELTGHAESDVLGLECRPHGPTRPGDVAGIAGSFCPPPEALAGRPAGGPTWIHRRNGERLRRRVEFWPFHDESGRLLGLLGLVRPAEDAPVAPDSEQAALRHALLDLRARLHARRAPDALIGVGPEHRRVLDGVAAAAATTIPVLLVGEPGTGKRFVARLIHGQGPRRQMPLLGFDAEAIPPDLLERELFGGPPTPGEPDRLAAPDGATVVLGDVLALPRDIQARLATSLDADDRPARLIATTAGDPDAARRSDHLRPDLDHALSALLIRLRPLRDRPDDLPLLAQSLLERANLRGPVARSGFSPAAVDTLRAYDWPGNLRELARVVDEAHARAAGDTIEVDDLPPAIRGERAGAYLPPAATAAPLPLKDRLIAFERELIEEALAKSRQNKAKAARQLGVNRPFLYRRIKELGIEDLPGAEPDEPGR